MRTVKQNFNLAANLKYLRNKRGLTQLAFSNIMGIPKGTYGVFECFGEGIGSERLRRIYDFYGIDEATALMDPDEFIKKIETPSL